MKVNENDLFEILWSKVGCEFMSDMTTAPYREQAIREVKRMELTLFGDKQIEDLCRYLSVSKEELLSQN